MSRAKVARWLIDKLLASFVVSAIIVYGPIIGFNIQTRSLGTTYTVVTSVSILISLLSYILVPQDFGVRRKIDDILGRSKEEIEDLE
jgi:hypothetical protein